MSLQDPLDRADAMCPGGAGNSHTLSLMLGGLGLRSAERTRGFAFCVQIMVRCNGE